MFALTLIVLAQCWAPDGGVIAAAGLDAPPGAGITLVSRLSPTNGDPDVVIDTANPRSHGYLTKWKNNGVLVGSVDVAGVANFPYVIASNAVFARTFYPIGPTGFLFASSRAVSDGSADFMFTVQPGRTEAMFEARVGYPGYVAGRLMPDGSFWGGHQGGEGAFVDASGVADPQGNAYSPSLTCHPGSNPSCYVYIAGNMKNDGFHGAVTIGNLAHRDANLGIIFQAVSRYGRPGALNADGKGQETIMHVSDLGDLKLWGGTVNAYIAGELPPCETGPDNGLGGPHTGAMAYVAGQDRLMLCTASGEWRRIPLEAQ